MVSPREFETFYSEMVQFDRFLGMELQVHGPGKITYTLEIQQAHLTTPDQCHGGVISAMMAHTSHLASEKKHTNRWIFTAGLV